MDAFIEEKLSENDVELTDAPEILRVRSGDKQAWTVLMRRYQEPVFRLAYLLLRDAAEAEDVAQETFIRAYMKLDQFDLKRPFRPWLLTITRNLAYNRQRGIKRYFEMTRRFFQQTPQVSKADLSDKVAQNSTADQLWQAVQQLTPAAQDVIYCRYFLQLSEQETADTLGIPAGTVKSRTYRAIRDLRALIKTHYPQLETVL